MLEYSSEKWVAGAVMVVAVRMVAVVLVSATATAAADDVTSYAVAVEPMAE